jgi:2-polyprenyl-6-methoxyphenol hydroxylase-like FAD-dependent oxidoreductase
VDIIIVGAGPTGLTLGVALARRGHRVVAVDHDPGPASDGVWRRRGVMQFDQAHGFRPQVGELSRAEWPEAWEAWLDLGAEPIDLSPSGASAPAIGVRSRRVTYERALRRAAAAVGGLTIRVGHVDRLAERGGRVVGAVVDGSTVRADLVIDASGRLSRFAPTPTIGADTGMAYVSRTYRRHPDAAPGPLTRPFAWSGMFRGYDSYVFPHERGHVSAVIIRPTADAGLGVLRHLGAFEAACRAIPGLAEWTDRRVATPASGVKVGGGLLNLYRPQLGRPGLVTVGDAVATTAPTAGRGLAMASMQIGALLQMLDAGAELATIAEPFAAWCDTWMLPWVEDHLAFDAEAVRRWQGDDIDLSRPLTSAAIVAAAQADPRIEPHIAEFMAMTALPASLAPAEPLARAVYDTGWRQPTAEGPTRDELVALAQAAGTQRPRPTATAPGELAERAAS